MASTPDPVRPCTPVPAVRTGGQLTAVPRPAPVIGPPESRTYRRIVVHLTDGLDGVLRVLVVLRQRAYHLRDVAVDVREGVVESRLECTVLLSGGEVDLLLARLHRTSVVTSAVRG